MSVMGNGNLKLYSIAQIKVGKFREQKPLFPIPLGTFLGSEVCATTWQKHSENGSNLWKAEQHVSQSLLVTGSGKSTTTKLSPQPAKEQLSVHAHLFAMYYSTATSTSTTT
eukprot:6061967-Amphidinium_carterae.2